MPLFEELLRRELPALERFVKFRIPTAQDAEDVLQETCLAAWQSFERLHDPASFKSWLLGIARNKCSDYYREQARRLEIPLDALNESVLSMGRRGLTLRTAVRDTLEQLGGTDQQILYLSYFRDLPQAEIVRLLHVPLGTVKSRLHHARSRFRERWPYQEKGENTMKKMPEYLPQYTITKSEKEAFPLRWEEMMGWFLVPKLGEKLSWAMYDFPERKRTEHCDMEVLGRAEVHGIQGVEIRAVEYEPMECNRIDGADRAQRRFVAQLTETHCRILAESHEEDGIRKLYTFLDGGDFLNSWGFGENNCGNEVNLAPKGDIRREGSRVTAVDKPFLLDVVGRYTVEIGGKRYDTVCVMDIETYNGGVASEQFLDQEGRTVLWRRFNRDDWAMERYQKPWHELLPENERITVNGQTYVHWYDCITDHIL